MKNYIPTLDHVFSVTKKLINSPAFLDRHRIKPTSFTRNRKMPFSSLFKYILHLPQKSLDSNLDDFFDKISPKENISLSKQAFSKQRQFISPNAFRELFLESAKFPSCFDASLWHDHSIYAIDGTSLQLPNTKVNRDFFGCAHNQSDSPMPMARATALYNVLDDRICDVVIDTYSTSERSHALKLINRFIHTDSIR